jgi:hypothetical protein
MRNSYLGLGIVVLATLAFAAGYVTRMRQERPVMLPPPPVLPPAVSAVATNSVHIVEEGEDIMSICQMYGVSLAAVLATNGLPPVRLVPGTRLMIPPSKPADLSTLDVPL